MRHVLCPVCQSVVDAADEECANCLDKEQAPTSTWTLFKLWRFAKPYQWQLLMGFLLTLASTAATLVPPYLTMPLMDDVLIPYQNGKSIDPVVVSWYLLGLFASAIVAWSLGWIKTYILALVSERIGADLRTSTYQHLLKLSLEYFGGRRTGDLIARIGSETDRINVFIASLVGFCNRRVDDRDDRRDLVFYQPHLGTGHSIAFAFHWLANSCCKRKIAHGL